MQFRSMSEKIVILLEDISSCQADTESVVRAAVSLSPFDVPEEDFQVFQLIALMVLGPPELHQVFTVSVDVGLLSIMGK